MKLNQTPSAERIHIGIFGKRNAGKSSLINALAGQPVSIVSDFKGTTTDPVKKAMELLPLGPVVLTDTPGLDDTGELGTLRIEKTQQILNTTDIALLVIDGQLGITEEDTRILQQIRQKQIPFVIAVNKMDLTIASPVLRPDGRNHRHHTSTKADLLPFAPALRLFADAEFPSHVPRLPTMWLPHNAAFRKSRYG